MIWHHQREGRSLLKAVGLPLILTVMVSMARTNKCRTVTRTPSECPLQGPQQLNQQVVVVIEKVEAVEVEVEVVVEEVVVVVAEVAVVLEVVCPCHVTSSRRVSTAVQLSPYHSSIRIFT